MRWLLGDVVPLPTGTLPNVPFPSMITNRSIAIRAVVEGRLGSARTHANAHANANAHAKARRWSLDRRRFARRRWTVLAALQQFSRHGTVVRPLCDGRQRSLQDRLNPTFHLNAIVLIQRLEPLGVQHCRIVRER